MLLYPSIHPCEWIHSLRENSKEPILQLYVLVRRLSNSVSISYQRIQSYSNCDQTPCHSIIGEVLLRKNLFKPCRKLFELYRNQLLSKIKMLHNAIYCHILTSTNHFSLPLSTSSVCKHSCQPLWVIPEQVLSKMIIPACTITNYGQRWLSQHAPKQSLINDNYSSMHKNFLDRWECVHEGGGRRQRQKTDAAFRLFAPQSTIHNPTLASNKSPITIHNARCYTSFWIRSCRGYFTSNSNKPSRLCQNSMSNYLYFKFR